MMSVTVPLDAMTLEEAWDRVYRENFATAMRHGCPLGGIAARIADTAPDTLTPYLPEGAKLRKVDGLWFVVPEAD